MSARTGIKVAYRSAHARARTVALADRVGSRIKTLQRMEVHTHTHTHTHYTSGAELPWGQ